MYLFIVICIVANLHIHPIVTLISVSVSRSRTPKDCSKLSRNSDQDCLLCHIGVLLPSHLINIYGLKCKYFTSLPESRLGLALDPDNIINDPLRPVKCWEIWVKHLNCIYE